MRRSPLLPIFLVVFVDVLGLTIVIPLLTIYAEEFGASPLVATLLLPTYSVCQLVAGPILGRLSDRYGRRRVLLVSQTGTLLGFVMMAESRWLWMLFAGRVLDGLTAGNLTVAQAYISDHTAPERRARSFALIGIAFGLGFMIGPVITAALVRYGHEAPFWAAAALSATSIAGTTFLLPRDKPTDTGGLGESSAGRGGIAALARLADYFRRPGLGGLLLQFFVYILSFSLFTSGFALYAERHLLWDGEFFTPREIGYTFALAGLIGAIVQGGLIGRAVARWGETRVAAFGFASVTIGYTLLGSDSSLYVLAFAITFASLGHAVMRPTLTSLITQRAGNHEQGSVLGVTQSLSSLATITAAPISGALIGRDLGRVWAWLAGGMALVGLALAPLGTARRVPLPDERALGGDDDHDDGREPAPTSTDIR